MAIDFNRFSDKARAAVQHAFRLAAQGHYEHITPELMMLSLITEGKDMVYFVLDYLHIDREGFTRTVNASLASLPHSNATVHNLSPQLLTVLDRSQSLTAQMGASITSLEHIFLALAYEPSNVRDIMATLGMTGESVRQAVEAFARGETTIPVGDTVDNPASHSMLDKFTDDMNELARQGKIQPAIGRHNEIRQILQVLAQKNKCNPVLVGPPGTGKTAIVEGLVHRIVDGDVPDELKGLHIYALQVSSLTAGADMHGQFEQRLKDIIAEVKSDPNIVLFIDEIHLLMGAGRSGGALDAANILKPAMSRDDIKIIGATTTDEYTRFIEKDQAFERRLQRVVIDEPDLESAIAIVRGVKARYEKFHRIKILDEAVVAAVNLSHRYITDHYLPDKAISLIDVAAAKMRIDRSSCPAELDRLRRTIRSKEIERESILHDGTDDSDLPVLAREIDNLRERENFLNAKWQNERSQLERLQQLQNTLEQLGTQREHAEADGQYNRAVELQRQLDETNARVNELTASIDNQDSPLLKTALDESDIMREVTVQTGIPVNRIRQDEGEKLRQLEDILRQSVIGQDEAVHTVSNIIRRNRLGFNDDHRPIGSFLFLGTTGVGKTELGKALAEYLFNSRDMIVRVDMSEYQQEHSVSRLFGAPPGYVGYDQGGQLTEAVRHKPYCVVLLDEIEKAHPKVFETLLQVLDDGRMTDGQGRVVNFKNAIIIMTSNFGAAQLLAAQQASAQGSQQAVAQARDEVVAGLRRHMSPEFVNRIDEIVVFNALSRDVIERIVRLQLEQRVKTMSGNGLEMHYDEASVKALAGMAYQPEFGARPVKRVIDRQVIDPLAMQLLDGTIDRSQPIYVSAPAGLLTLSNHNFADARLDLQL